MGFAFNHTQVRPAAMQAIKHHAVGRGCLRRRDNDNLTSHSLLKRRPNGLFEPFIDLAQEWNYDRSGAGRSDSSRQLSV
jgi:hypothetical protein